MKGVRKEFNKKLNRDNDPMSRHVVKKFFEDQSSYLYLQIVVDNTIETV